MSDIPQTVFKIEESVALVLKIEDGADPTPCAMAALNIQYQMAKEQFADAPPERQVLLRRGGAPAEAMTFEQFESWAKPYIRAWLNA